MSERSRVLIADEDHLGREMRKRVINQQPDLEVIGEAQDSQGALDLCHRLLPAVVLIEAHLCVAKASFDSAFCSPMSRQRCALTDHQVGDGHIMTKSTMVMTIPRGSSYASQKRSITNSNELIK